MMQSLSLEQSFQIQNKEVDEGSNQTFNLKPFLVVQHWGLKYGFVHMW